MQKTTSFRIGNKVVGISATCFIIAEVAQAHDGSLGFAHAFIDSAADAGADAIKFQTHIAEQESTLDEPWRIRFSEQDKTRFDYWRRMSFSLEQWAGLAEHTRERELIFLSSPFSISAVELLEKLDIPAWKVASGEINSNIILDSMAKTGKPILVSTGMSCWQEIDAIVEKISRRGNSLAIFQCTSQYPTPLENVGLNVIHEMRERYGVPTGLSDHSGSVFPSLVAIAQGTDLLEVHVTFDKKVFGPDVSSSLTFEQLQHVVGVRDSFDLMVNSPVDKDRLSEKMSTSKGIFSRSIAPARALKAGTVLTEGMLSLKKPGTGIKEKELSMVTGKKLIHDVNPDRLLRWEDIGE
jgi:N,N'-diacetyllegionaminate synthase